MAALPREMKVAVLRHLSLAELVGVELVSKDWRAAARDKALFSKVKRATIQGGIASTNDKGLGNVDRHLICSKAAAKAKAEAQVGMSRKQKKNWAEELGSTSAEVRKAAAAAAGRGFVVGFVRHLLERGAHLRSLELLHIPELMGLTSEVLGEMAAVLAEWDVELESLALCFVVAYDQDWIRAFQALVKGQSKLQRLVLGPFEHILGHSLDVLTALPWVDALSGLADLRVLVFPIVDMQEGRVEKWLETVGRRLDCLFVLTEYQTHNESHDDLDDCPELAEALASTCPQLKRQEVSSEDVFVWTSSQFSQLAFGDTQLHSVNFWVNFEFLQYNSMEDSVNCEDDDKYLIDMSIGEAMDGMDDDDSFPGYNYKYGW